MYYFLCWVLLRSPSNYVEMNKSDSTALNNFIFTNCTNSYYFFDNPLWNIADSEKNKHLYMYLCIRKRTLSLTRVRSRKSRNIKLWYNQKHRSAFSAESRRNGKGRATFRLAPMKTYTCTYASWLFFIWSDLAFILSALITGSTQWTKNDIFF